MLWRIFREREVVARFWTMPASARHHHALPGGLAVHSLEVARNLAGQAAVGGHERDLCIAAGLLHDIGKVCIPDAVLLKPGLLNEEERGMVRVHPGYGSRFLSVWNGFQGCMESPRFHHEWWDGSGYPRGLQGEEIPLEARIFALVDVWDALRSDRPYRPAWDGEKVLAHLREGSGKHFDPRVVEAFFALHEKGAL